MIGVLIVLIVIGVLLYLVEVYIPMAPPIKLILRVVVVLFVALWLLKIFGVLDVPVPRVR